MSIALSEIMRWETWLRAAGRPPTTIALRTYHVRRVMAEIGLSPWALTTEDLVTYLGGQVWAPETRRAYRSSLRGFYRWAQATGRRLDDPAALLPAVKVPRGVPRPTPDAHYRQALAKAAPRERLMIHLGAHCGLRRGEIAQARREDVSVDLVGHCLRVIGKGGHERMVPLPDELAAQILAHPPGWLFPSPGTPGGHLTPHHVGKLVSALLPDGWTCHTLRHRCATVAYAHERDLRAVQELLGHARTDTTARYTQVPVDAIRRAVNAAAA